MTQFNNISVNEESLEVVGETNNYILAKRIRLFSRIKKLLFLKK